MTHDPRPLTPAQRRVLEVIQQHVEANGEPPTLCEVGDALGVSSVTVFGHVWLLEAKGWLDVTPKKSRGIVVLHPVPTPLRQRAQALCDAVEAGVTGEALAELVRGVRDAIGSEVVK